ncbi:MAG TPA: 3-deoxy-7-phosphoheptulonate synthase [Gemmatimonadota bacterium]|nr:3-deoxy-7-phosphoheptulonate synthase [Gemmatimonadota bacterium]
MIVILKPGVTLKAMGELVHFIESQGLRVGRIVRGEERTVLGIIGEERHVSIDRLRAFEGVEDVVPVLKPFKLVSRELQAADTVVRGDGFAFGGGGFSVIAGPCAVESAGQILETAHFLKEHGAQVLRGGAYKPRTSPYSFQGMEVAGLELLARAREETGLAIITEVVSAEDVPDVASLADILQVGARNMQNFRLLRCVGRSDRPVFLKRGQSATLEEFLLAAEYIVAEGNPNVILCERGIRTFERYTRNTLDIAAVPVLKGLSHLPVVVDPSHATGRRELVPPLALAALAAGADGIMVEVHPDPENALSDGPQSLTFPQFAGMMGELERLRAALRSQPVGV